MDDASLSAAQRSRVRRLARPEGEASGSGELNVVPYLDILLNVMLFVLASLTVVFASSVEARADAIGPVRGHPPALQLAVLVTHGGVVLKTAGENIAPGCKGVGAGVTVPDAGGRLDAGALTICARRVKEVDPRYADERSVTITAEPGIELQRLMDVADALRSDAGGPLFPNVALGVVR